MNSRLFVVVSMIIVILLSISCRSNEGSVDLTEVKGNWTMIKAERNGNETETLDNAFFNIDDETFSHNLNGDTIQAAYSINGTDLIIKDQLLQKIEIKRLVGDTMQVHLNISKYDFNFLMKKDGK